MVSFYRLYTSRVQMRNIAVFECAILDVLSHFVGGVVKRSVKGDITLTLPALYFLVELEKRNIFYVVNLSQVLSSWGIVGNFEVH